MRLADLEPKFFRYDIHVELVTVIVGDGQTWRECGCPTEEVTRLREYHVDVALLTEAQGVRFLCPKCYVVNGGPVGTHCIDVSFAGRGVPAGHGTRSHGEDRRWAASGTGLSDLTLSPSILVEGGCAWHGHLTQGAVTTC